MWKSKKSEHCVNWLSVSDVHLGHLRTSTEEILDHLEELLFDGRIASLDLLMIAGDLFERQLEYNHPATGRILLFVDRLMQECSKYNTVLRILEGTPSHDNKQNKVFVELYATGNYTCDMKYVDKVSIEYFPQWDARALYVPDLHPVEEIWKNIVGLLESHGIQQVDFAVMHGAFSHQLPPMAKEVYNPDDFLKIVKHWILIGHVHFHSIYDRIAAGGSFDRLCHGEEGAKGLLMGTMNFGGDPKNDEIYFIENTRAKKYITVDCTADQSVEESLVKLEDIVGRLPNDSYVRVRAGKGNPIFSNWSVVTKINMANTWTKDEKLLEEEETLTEAEKEEGLESWVPIHIDRGNISDIVMERIHVHYADDPLITEDVIDLARSIIREYL